MPKKKQAEESSEVEYEYGLVEYETPAVPKLETPKKAKAKDRPRWVRDDDNMLNHDCGCWCGAPRAIRKRCDGHPTAVRFLPGGTPNFVCPAGNGITSPPKAMVQAAEKAGLLAKEKPNG